VILLLKYAIETDLSRGQFIDRVQKMNSMLDLLFVPAILGMHLIRKQYSIRAAGMQKGNEYEGR